MPITITEFRKRGKCCMRIIVMAHKSKPNKNTAQKKNSPSYILFPGSLSRSQCPNIFNP